MAKLTACKRDQDLIGQFDRSGMRTLLLPSSMPSVKPAVGDSHQLPVRLRVANRNNLRRPATERSLLPLDTLAMGGRRGPSREPCLFSLSGLLVKVEYLRNLSCL